MYEIFSIKQAILFFPLDIPCSRSYLLSCLLMPWLLVDVEKSFEDINFKENNNRVGRSDSKTSLDTIKQRGPMDSQHSSCRGPMVRKQSMPSLLSQMSPQEIWRLI